MNLALPEEAFSKNTYSRFFKEFALTVVKSELEVVQKLYKIILHVETEQELTEVTEI